MSGGRCERRARRSRLTIVFRPVGAGGMLQNWARLPPIPFLTGTRTTHDTPPAQARRPPGCSGTFFAEARQHLLACIRPDEAAGESPELPRLMQPHEDTTASVDFWTNKPVRETTRSHVNYVIADSGWEAQAAFKIDKDRAVSAYFKNTGKHFTIPYEIAGDRHEFWPDFIIRLTRAEDEYLILETKGHDPFAEAKQAAAVRWCDAVTADGRWGRWSFRMARSVADVSFILEEVAPSRG